jgi:hypothetical protein
VLAREDIEGFLDRLAIEGTSYHEPAPGLWLVRPGGEIDLDVAVSYVPPVVVIRVKVMALPTDPADLARLSRQLLEWNANDLLHGSYGISDDHVVLTEALELGHLDYEEFVAAYESMTMALNGHLRELAFYREAR